MGSLGNFNRNLDVGGAKDNHSRWQWRIEYVNLTLKEITSGLAREATGS